MPLHRMVSAAPRHTFCVNSLAVAVNTPHNPRMKSGDCTCVWQAPGWPNDGFDGKLTSTKWAAIAKCSPDTALRDITELLTRGVLRKANGGGRSTSYELSQWSE